MPGTCASLIISNNKQIRSQKNQCFKVKCLVHRMESFSYFVYCSFVLFHDAVSNTGCVVLNNWITENLPEGSEQNQEDHSNNCVSVEMLTGHLRNKGQIVTAWATLLGRSCKQFIPRSCTVFCNCYILLGKCASLVFRVALGYGLDDAPFQYRKGQEIFLFPQLSRPALDSARSPI
jgi:hypothetical protein